MTNRQILRGLSISADAAAVIVASMSATWLRSRAHLFMNVEPFRMSVDWSTVMVIATVVVSFYVNGLYESEAYVSRPLHTWIIARSAFLAFIGSAVVIYVVKSDRVDQSRLILGLTFALFVVIDWALRVWLVDSVYVSNTRRDLPLTWVVGDSSEAIALAQRLESLRGFSSLELIPTSVLRPGVGESLTGLIENAAQSGAHPGAIFIDTLSVSAREVFDMSAAGLAQSVDVYVLSGLLGPLEGSATLYKLFRAPVVRLRRSLRDADSYLFKRTFDVVGSATLLLLVAPFVAVIAVMIKVTSPGPVFYTQTRVGRLGQPFRFYKFRSMVVDNDSDVHERYVKAYIHGDDVSTGSGEDDAPTFKITDDVRVTRIGRFIRKYSLDEIPQFYNVLVGDMSLVGPRPPLPYEVEEYEEWHALRLLVPPGVTGMWQVEGRSRVTFDEMVLQDLMYAKNMRLLVDVDLCLRTVPAALLGYGGA